MKITICGSLTFSKEMLQAKEKLEQMGYEVNIPKDALDVAFGNYNNDDLEADYQRCVEDDITRTHFKLIEDSDAILILNYDKNNIKGYIGAASLLELGLAHHLRKKIFLLNPFPHPSEQRWAHEVRIMQPIILNGDLSKIS